jgi:hypothetical protein
VAGKRADEGRGQVAVGRFERRQKVERQPGRRQEERREGGGREERINT